jgi:hypothetical protein
MTARDRLHQLVDEIPDDKVSEAEQTLELVIADIIDLATLLRERERLTAEPLPSPWAPGPIAVRPRSQEQHRQSVARRATTRPPLPKPLPPR